MTRILLSLFTIGVVMASATAATLAFFQTTQTFSNDPSVLNSATDVTFTAQLALDNGTPAPFTATIAPGQTLKRCLWVRNTGGVPARFKVYMNLDTETGSAALGDALLIDAKATPDEGRCTANPPTISGASTLYTNFTDGATWLGADVRGTGFYDPASTPFRTDVDEDPMLPNQYSVWQFDLRLPSDTDSSVANQSYQFNGTIFAVQEGGTL